MKLKKAMQAMTFLYNSPFYDLFYFSLSKFKNEMISHYTKHNMLHFFICMLIFA